MKNFQLFFLILVLALGTQTLKANYEYFSAFEGIGTAKQKMLELNYSSVKLLLIGASPDILDGNNPNSAIDGKTQKWSYLFAVYKDTKLVLISVVKQNGSMTSEFILESNYNDVVRMGYDDVIINDFNELPQNLFDSDSILVDIYHNHFEKININPPCTIHSIIISSVDNIGSKNGNLENEGYIWHISTSCYDSEPLGTFGGWVECDVSAINGKNLGCVSSTGVNDINIQLNAIDIHPNPSNDFITITLSNKELQLFATTDKVKIFDVLGIEVISELIHPITASHRMNVEKLPAGVYFIRIGNRVEKFVKM